MSGELIERLVRDLASTKARNHLIGSLQAFREKARPGYFDSGKAQEELQAALAAVDAYCAEFAALVAEECAKACDEVVEQESAEVDVPAARGASSCAAAVRELFPKPLSGELIERPSGWYWSQRDLLERLATEAGFRVVPQAAEGSFRIYTDSSSGRCEEALGRFAALVTEGCAKACEDLLSYDEDDPLGTCAAAIRARFPPP